MTDGIADPVRCPQTVLAGIKTIVKTSVQLCVFICDSRGFIHVTLRIEGPVGCPDISIIVIRSTSILVTQSKAV
jgi:hypothetical protein